jgi:hypothetical protein
MCELNVSIAGITGDCLNTNSGGFTILINGDAPDYTVQWINPLYGTIPLGGGVIGYTIDNLSAGTYTFNVVDSCVPINNSYLVNVNISSGTCVSLSGIESTTCGFNNGSLTATTTNLYTEAKFYLYETTYGYVASATTFNNFYSFNSLSAGTYYVVGDDGGGCTGKSESCIVLESNPIDVNLYVVNASSCSPNTGAIYITGATGTPPFTYSWNTTPIQTTSFITGLTVGNYILTMTDNTGCVVSKGVTISAENPLGLFDISFTNPSCFSSDGTVTITASGGTSPFQFVGSNGQIDTTFSNTNTFYNLPAGFFTVVVKDAGNCSFTATTSLLTAGGLSIASVNITNSTCSGNGGQISVTVFGGSPPYVYTLTDSLGSNTVVSGGFPNWTFNGLTSGTYTLTITDEGPCDFIQTYEVENNVLFELNIDTTGTTCNQDDGSVLLSITSGGTAPFHYEIDGYSDFSNNLEYFYDNLPSGNYVATVTDANYCQQELPFTIDGSDSVDFLLIGTDSLDGNNGTIGALITNGEPPFTLTWSSNVGTQTGTEIIGLSAGTYTLTVTDNNGCSKIRTIILNGFNKLASYQVYNICDEDFENTGQTGRKGPQEMLVEGFHDLTIGDVNCILNQAIFTVITTVNGITKSDSFYTGTTLTDFPSDNEFYNVLETLLLTYDGVGDVIVNAVKNTLTINTSCDANLTLLDADVKVEMDILYDINCESCDDFCNCYEISGPKDCVVNYIDCNGNPQTLTLLGTENQRICGREITDTICDSCTDPIKYMFKVINSKFNIDGGDYLDSFENIFFNGIVITNASGRICCSSCEGENENYYMLSSLYGYETYLELGELPNCCNNYTGETSTYNEYVNELKDFFGQVPQQCNSEFNTCLNDLKTLIGTTNFNILFNDYGFLENPLNNSETLLCSLVEELTYLVNDLGVSISDCVLILENILGNSLTSMCKNDTIYIGNLKSFFTYLDYTNRGTLPPADCPGIVVNEVGSCVEQECPINTGCTSPITELFSTLPIYPGFPNTYVENLITQLSRGFILDNTNLEFCCPEPCNNENVYFLGDLKNFSVYAKVMGLPDCCVNTYFDANTFGEYVELTNLGKDFLPKACCDSFEPCMEYFFEYFAEYPLSSTPLGAEIAVPPSVDVEIFRGNESKRYAVERVKEDFILNHLLERGSLGLIEISKINGGSIICDIINSLDTLPYSISDRLEIFEALISTGLYIGCDNDELFIGNFKAYYEWKY